MWTRTRRSRRASRSSRSPPSSPSATAQVVDKFVGAVPEEQVQLFIDRLSPPPSEADELVASGDEASLRRALELEPDHVGAVAGLARLLLDRRTPRRALELLARVPETPDCEPWPPRPGCWATTWTWVSDVSGLLDSLLDRVQDDDAARQEFVDRARDARARRSPDDPLPQGAGRPTVLMPAPATGVGAALRAAGGGPLVSSWAAGTTTSPTVPW